MGAQWNHFQQSGQPSGDFDWDQWQAAGGQGQASYRTVSPEEFEELFGARGGYSDFFEKLFGMGAQAAAGGRYHGPAGPHPQRPRRGHNLEHGLQVTLEEAFYGATRMLQWEDGHKIEAKIPPGVKAGSRVRLKGQGTPGFDAGEAGDLFLKIELGPHKRFERRGDDLKCIVDVDLLVMLLGGKVPVSGIDRTVMLDIPPQTANGRIFRLREMGMPKLKKPDQRGDLLVGAQALLPRNLTDQEKEILRQWQRIRK